MHRLGSPLAFVFTLWIELAYHNQLGILCKSANICSRATFLCSENCPRVPKDFIMTNGIAMCLKDYASQTCICWKNSGIEHKSYKFACEVLVNGTVNQIHCQLPDDCFPDSSDVLCLIVLDCDCLGLEEEMNHSLESWKNSPPSWKPVKAYMELPQPKKGFSEKDDFQSFPSLFSDDFQLKHLLLLVGFILTPLLCWGALYLYHESNCRKKQAQDQTLQESVQNSESDLQTEPALFEDRDLNSSQPCETQASSHTDGALVYVAGNSLETGICLSRGALQSVVSRCVQPPSYEEAISNNTEIGPPPAYEDMDETCSPPPVWQTVLIVHTRRNE